MSLVLRNAIWHIRKKINGIAINESTKTGNRRLAEQIMAKRINEVTQEVVLGGRKPIKLHDALDAFVKSRSHMPSAKGCEIHCRHFKALPNHNLDKITDSELDALLYTKREAGYKESTIKVSVTYFNAMITFCESKGFTVRKKMRAIKHNSKRVRWMTKDELKKFMDVIDPANVGIDDFVLKAQRQENFDLVRLLADTAGRFSEVAHMNWSQVDLAAGTVYMKRKKGSISGTIGMTATMKEIFTRRRQFEKGVYVFSSKVGKANNKWVDTAVKRAGLDESQGSISLHTIRHSTSVHLLQAGMNLLELQKFLGHRTIESTMVYAHAIQEDVTRKAVTLLDAR